MQSSKDHHYDIIKKASSILYTLLNGEKKLTQKLYRPPKVSCLLLLLQPKLRLIISK